MDDDAPSWLTGGGGGGGNANSSFVDPMEPPPSATLKAAEVPKSSLIDDEGNIISNNDTEDSSKKSKKKNSKRASKKAAASNKSAERTMLEASTGAATTVEQQQQPITEVDEKKLNAAIVFMRMANMGVSIALIACCIVNLLGIPRSISVWVLSIYAMCGGLLICCLETQLKFLRSIIAMNFGFLLNGGLRFLFYLLLASVTFSQKTLFGYIVAICLIVVAFYNTYVLCKYPTYRSMREKLASEEDKRIQEKINKETKKQVIRNMMGS